MLDIDSTLLKRYDNIEHNIQKGVALYGAGQNGRWCLRYLRNCGFDVKCFYDSAADKIKRYVDDIPVIEWLGSSDYVVLVTAKHCVQEILDKIDEDNVMSFDAWFIIRNLNPYDELQFEDEKSNKVKIAVQKAMLAGNEEQLCEVVSNRQYFCLPQFWGRINETFVDLGAYVGDTVEKFIQEHNGCFDKIYAFEPGEKQNRALRYRCDRMKEEWALPDDKIIIEKMVVGGEKGIVSTNPNSYLQSLSFGQINRGGKVGLEAINLDEYFENKRITFLKADIEGMEIEMLKGGEKVIKRDKPKIAICVYHCPDDLLEIYKLLRSWVPEYKMSLRQHSSQLMETVLYCYL